MIELAELKEAKIPKDEFRTEAVRKGRPAKPGSIREVAKEIGVSPMTLHDAQKHVEAVKKYPDLEQVPKYKAISEARERDGVISLAKEKVRRAEMENRQLDEDEIVYKRYRKACKGLSDLRFMLESSDDMLALARFSSMYSEDLHDPNDPSDIVGYDAEIEFIDRYIDTLKQIKGHLLSAKAKGVSYGKK